jgi:hypothetical protein
MVSKGKTHHDWFLTGCLFLKLNDWGKITLLDHRVYVEGPSKLRTEIMCPPALRLRRWF